MRYSLFDLQMLTAPEYRNETILFNLQLLTAPEYRDEAFVHDQLSEADAICPCHWHFFCDALPRLIQETLE